MIRAELSRRRQSQQPSLKDVARYRDAYVFILLIRIMNLIQTGTSSPRPKKTALDGLTGRR